MDAGVPGGKGAVAGWFATESAGTDTLICGALHEGQNVVCSSTGVPQR